MTLIASYELKKKTSEAINEEIKLEHKLSCRKCNAECCRTKGNAILKDYDMLACNGNDCMHLSENKCMIYTDRERPLECWAYPYTMRILKERIIITSDCIGTPQYVKATSLTSQEATEYKEFIEDFMNLQWTSVERYWKKKYKQCVNQEIKR